MQPICISRSLPHWEREAAPKSSHNLHCVGYLVRRAISHATPNRPILNPWGLVVGMTRLHSACRSISSPTYCATYSAQLAIWRMRASVYRRWTVRLPLVKCICTPSILVFWATTLVTLIRSAARLPRFPIRSDIPTLEPQLRSPVNLIGCQC
jgi:hypothetical protein